MISLNKSSSVSYVALKCHDLLSVFRRQDSMEKKKGFIEAYLNSSLSPATKAARTLAIINSGQADSLKNEYWHPSFDDGQNDIFKDLRMPSKFTEKYTVTDEFVTSENDYENNYETASDIFAIEVMKNKDIRVALFNLPVMGEA